MLYKRASHHYARSPRRFQGGLAMQPKRKVARSLISLLVSLKD